MSSSESSIGLPLDRVDGHRKVTGTARYAGEFTHHQLVHAVVVQSTIARGRVLAIDTAAALRTPGVLALLTHHNVPRLRTATQGEPAETRLPLSDDIVHYAGQHVALVVATAFETARFAASKVGLTYAEERAVLEMDDALAAPELPREAQYRRGEVEVALARSDLVQVSATYSTPVETHNPMEPSATIAAWRGDRLTVSDSTQSVMNTRAFLAGTFGIPQQHVRVLCPFTGGAFGSRSSQWAHTLLATMAAQVVRRPVKLVLSREQMFTSSGHRPPTRQTITLGARHDGSLIAIRHDTVNATSPTVDYIEACGSSTSKRLYACANVDAPQRRVRVNVAPPTYMRAPGECPGTFALESAMDELAYRLGLDPIELRRRNAAPMDPADGRPWSSKHLDECYALGAERFGWAARSPQPRAMREGGRLVGWGMASALFPGYRNGASASIQLSQSGGALVRSATQDLGTGAYTVFTQVAADALGIPFERVTFELGDSDFPEAPASVGAASTASVSEAILRAAELLKQKLLILANGQSKSLLAGYEEVLRHAGVPTIEAQAQILPEEIEQKASIYSWGAQFCEVQIDPLLPRVQVTRWVSVIDAGRILNPKTSRSQIIGGVTMGLGMALLEETHYDARTGRPVNANLADYVIPSNPDVPAIEVHFLDYPDPVINALGCRGVGEIGIVGAAAAIANAVFHATGRRVRDLPITPDKLL